MPFAEIWKDLEIIILSEIRERQSYDITYMWNLDKLYKWTYLENRNRPTDIENKPMVTKGESGQRVINEEFGTNRYTTTIYKMDKQPGSTV